ncbi:MAG: hypothetical protein AB7V26_00320 [Lysobacterales bacterium]
MTASARTGTALALFAAFAALLLAGCVGKPQKRVNPPQLSIQSLELQSGRRIVLELRLQNHSDVPMHFGSIDADLLLASHPADQVVIALDLDVSPHSAEIFTYHFQPNDLVAGLFRRALDSGIGYRLIGSIHSNDPEQDFELRATSQLNPVPGKPGQFR